MAVNQNCAGGAAAEAGRGGFAGVPSISLPAVAGLTHNPGLSSKWSAAEQAILEKGLCKHFSDPTMVSCLKIGMQLPQKTVRDVALRCKWMAERSAFLAAQPSDTPQRFPENDGDIIFSEAVATAIGQLLEYNHRIIVQITNNLRSSKIKDNIALFCEVRESFLKVLYKLNHVPKDRKEMPPLPVEVNVELGDFMLPTIFYL